MSSESPRLSVVIPVFNERGTLDELFKRLTAALSEQPGGYEIIAVDDGSTDGSREILRGIHAQDPRIRVVFLSRNFGQSPALYAGFSRARGQYIAMMDADLQNYPEDIPRLVAKLEEGFDMVSGWRSNRQDSLFRTAASKLLNRYINSITRVALNDYGCALKAFRRELVDHMLALTHRCRYLPVDAAALGGRVAEIEVRHDQRGHGESKYGLVKLVRTAFDLITSITAAPLQFIGLMGWLFAAIGFCMSLWVAYVRIAQGDINHMGTVVAIFFFLSGCQMVATGLMCEYISRIYIEVQAKPYFVVQEELE
jgi:undecaprenyl-phosphate 4-deoxy-4-formamido-L-arabinose transferase